LLALCLDLIFRFVPSNGFANEEVRDENRNEEHEGGKDYNEGSRHEEEGSEQDCTRQVGKGNGLQRQ